MRLCGPTFFFQELFFIPFPNKGGEDEKSIENPECREQNDHNGDNPLS